MSAPKPVSARLLSVALAALVLALVLGLFAAIEPPLVRVTLVGLALAVTGLVGTAAWRGRRLRSGLGALARSVEHLSAHPGDAAPVLPVLAESGPLAAGIERLVETWSDRASNLQGERDHYREILAAMSDGVLETDSKGRVRLVNPAFRTLFRLEGPVEGRTVLELTRHPELAEQVRRTLAGEPPLEVEVAPGGGRVALLSGSRLPGGGALVVARNVTDRVRLDTTKRDFVANISHELKTPLTAIRGYAETLREGALEKREVAGRFTERILNQCRRLEALLADLLALSRLESAGFMAEENRTLVDLEELCRRALETVHGPAREREVELRLECEPLPKLTGYPEALERLLVNLLDNAIKYNRQGGWVRVGLTRQDGHVELEVRDSGIGIPEDALARVFERFYRVDKGRARDEGGTGLGLALVKHAAMLHDGQVEVESRLGGGSTFRVLLPLPAD